MGQFFQRLDRGLLSRPTVEEVYRYRAHVDRVIGELIDTVADLRWDEVARRIELGLQHEQQHQELLLTDLKYNFAFNPLRPAYRPADNPGQGERVRAARGHRSPARLAGVRGGGPEHRLRRA